MSEQRPALIIRLTIDADTAFARKPDHHLSELRDKIEIMPRIRYNGANVCDIDSRMPYPQVLEARSEEHTSELQSLMRISYAVFCLKKKKTLQKVNKHSNK